MRDVQELGTCEQRVSVHILPPSRGISCVGSISGQSMVEVEHCHQIQQMQAWKYYWLTDQRLHLSSATSLAVTLMVIVLRWETQKLGSRNPVPLQAVPYLNFSIPGYQKSTSTSGINLQGHHTFSYQKESQEVPSRGRQAGCSRPPDALTWHPSDLQLSSSV